MQPNKEFVEVKGTTKADDGGSLEKPEATVPKQRPPWFTTWSNIYCKMHPDECGFAWMKSTPEPEVESSRLPTAAEAETACLALQLTREGTSAADFLASPRPACTRFKYKVYMSPSNMNDTKCGGCITQWALQEALTKWGCEVFPRR